jgi:hypothetical protein
MFLSTPIPIALGIALVLILLIGSSLHALKRRRLMEDLPTSKTTGVFIGLVELKGTAETETPFTGFLSDERCVYYSWEVTEHYRRSGGKSTKSGNERVASGGESCLFYLRDDLDVVRIDPYRAEIIAETVFTQTCTKSNPLYYSKGPDTSVRGSTGKRTFTEKAIKLHQPIYVVGQARERTDCVAAEIAYDQMAPMFLISTKPEETLRTQGLLHFWGYALFAAVFPFIAVAMALCFWARHMDGLNQFWHMTFGGDWNQWWFMASCLSVSVIPIWLVGWLWTVYNSMIGLRNRLRMAVANIDVELKRRHDLIPQLGSIVVGLRKHERDIQETVALLRGQLAIQSISECGNEHNRNASPARACARRIIALAERYPELKANNVFLNLQDNLVKTEQRIALARNYYNDVIEAYNNRRGRFPECLVAVLARLQPVSPFVAENFERDSIKVDLVR